MNTDNKTSPLFEIQNFGRYTHVVFCGVDLSKAIYNVQYFAKESGAAANRPMMRLDIDVQAFIELLERVDESTMDEALGVLTSYFHEKELIKKWRSQLKETPEVDQRN